MKRKALEEIFLAHRDDLYDYLMLHIKDHDLAQDLTQDVFLKLSKRSKDQEVIDQPSSYLFILARNMVIDYWRKAAVNERVQKEFWSNVEKEKYVYQYPSLQYDKKVIFNEITQLLTEQQKTIFILNRNEGFSYNEIADKLNLSRSTVKNHMVSALKKIRSHIIKNKLYPVFLLILHWLDL
ncbi:RNA polymerase sigma factor [Membranihabitans maritimus]|uniref:RNA polymerase sigma factor n=1 Tax=Membranihabitans maritimus TaxID=2904244 RepID=UPI001F00C3B0|nr:sigma-70 family RNA polymerase sigma factor [Membranihabitans maritimus]